MSLHLRVKPGPPYWVKIGWALSSAARSAIRSAAVFSIPCGVCVRVRARLFVRVCVCACELARYIATDSVREREREREREIA